MPAKLPGGRRHCQAGDEVARRRARAGVAEQKTEREEPMSENVARFILNRLTEWGVRRIYGYPGDGINGLLGAFHHVGDRLEFVQVRHEEIASFAASAHAKFTGEVGVCMATSGPGAVHLLNGLYDAKLDK